MGTYGGLRVDGYDQVGLINLGSRPKVLSKVSDLEIFKGSPEGSVKQPTKSSTLTMKAHNFHNQTQI